MINNIAQISTLERGGGAEKIAYNLYKAYQNQGFASRLIVGNKQSTDSHIFLLDNIEILEKLKKITSRYSLMSWYMRIPFFLLYRISHFIKNQRILQGRERFDYPGIRRLIKQDFNPDIIHIHNMHGGYFDMRFLPKLSEKFPLLVTLHDSWLLTGHCAHSFDCDNWKTGCGLCPDLTIPPSILFDNTAFNWRRKRQIIKKAKPFIVTPCQWLMDRVVVSGLAGEASGTAVIPNGIDISIFVPGDRLKARTVLGLDQNELIIIFAAHGIRNNPWKDYALMRRAIEMLSDKKLEKSIRFLALGEQAPEEKIGNIIIQFLPHQQSEEFVVKCYQASNIYIHAARADTFPNTILEAQACGLPVVATAVGGIPEQISEGVTGYLTQPGDAVQFAERVKLLLLDDLLRDEMGASAVKMVRKEFSLEMQVSRYLKQYQEILIKNEDRNFK